MAAELMLDASVSLAWFLKETPERATYAAAVNAAAAEKAPSSMSRCSGASKWGTCCFASTGAKR